jgi:transcription-repair coupling factor (superfamily II helicase)
MAQKAGLSEVVVMGDKLRIAPADLADSIQVRLQRMYPGARYLAAGAAVVVPLPPEPTDAQLIEWTGNLLVAIFGAEVAAAAAEAEPGSSSL